MFHLLVEIELLPFYKHGFLKLHLVLSMVIKFQHDNFETMENKILNHGQYGTTTNGSGPSCSNIG